MGLGGGVGEAEASGIGGDAGVQACRDIGGDLHSHLGDHIDHDFAGCRSTGVQQRFVGIAVVAGMMVDAQVHVLGILLHIVAVTEQLDARHVHRHHKGGGETGIEPADLHKIIQRRDRVAAKHGHILAQGFQRQVQRTGTSDGVAVGVLMA